MSCNAWNHAPGCDCGWGGVFHGNGAALSQALSWPMAVGSWINPNARCPVCKAPVFFYKSPTGGRVYFDALGAPWPRHPCVSSENEANGSVNEVPDSTYWRARDYFLTFQRRVVSRGGIKILFLSNKKFTDWLVEEVFFRGIKNNKYPPTVAFWIICLPHTVLGDAELDFERIKKPVVIAMANRIKEYLTKYPPNNMDQKICLKTALLLLDKYSSEN